MEFSAGVWISLRIYSTILRTFEVNSILSYTPSTARIYAIAFIFNLQGAKNSAWYFHGNNSVHKIIFVL